MGGGGGSRDTERERKNLKQTVWSVEPIVELDLTSPSS